MPLKAEYDKMLDQPQGFSGFGQTIKVVLMVSIYRQVQGLVLIFSGLKTSSVVLVLVSGGNIDHNVNNIVTGEDQHAVLKSI